MKYQTDKVITYVENGELLVCDSDAELEPKKIWSRQSCKKRIFTLLESLPASEREANKTIKEWWRKVVEWQEKESAKDELNSHWSNYCVHELIDAWEEIHGAPDL